MQSLGTMNPTIHLKDTRGQISANQVLNGENRANGLPGNPFNHKTKTKSNTNQTLKM